MSDRISHPTQVYSFNDFSLRTPGQQQPGDRLDAQFNNHADVLNQIIVVLNDDEAKLVRKDDLAPDLIDSLTQNVLVRTAADVQSASTAATAAQASAELATDAAILAASNAVNAKADADTIRTGQGSVLSALEQLSAVATGQFITLQNAKAAVDNSQNDAAYAAALASDYAVAAQAWAENMPDVIPPNILAVMGITGDHWSSRWWANQALQYGNTAQDWANQAKQSADDAAAALDQFTDLYLGPHPANPTLDNDGNPLQVGAIYYNTSDHNMYVWSGTLWQVSSSAKGWVPEAPTDGAIYSRKNAAWVVAAGGVSDAPNDGNAYARKSLTWTQLNSNDMIFGTGPGTVTGAVNLKADQSALTSEINARVAGDQANANAITNLKASGIANDSSVTGATVKDALNTNQTAINTNASQIAANTSAIATKQNHTTGLDNFSTLTPTLVAGDVLYATAADTLARLPHGNVNESLTVGPSNLPIWKLAAAPIAVTDNPPASALDSSLWWESDTGYLYLKYNDGNSSQWVQVNGIPAAVTAGYVAKSGDTMTGNLTIAPASGVSSLNLNKPAGSANQIRGTTAGSLRWAAAFGSSAAESGANAGSDFILSRYDDSGNSLDSPLFISRATGMMTLYDGLTITKPYAAVGDEALTIAPPSGAPTIQMLKPTGQANNLCGRNSAGLNRWILQLGNAAAESGSNAGSDFALGRYSDAGAFIDTPLSIGRAGGAATFSNQVIAIGYGCRPGTAGAFTGYYSNLNYVSPNAQIWIGTTNLGNITVSSDYRIKKDVTPLSSTWDRVKALKPISYTHQDYTPPNAALRQDGTPQGPLILADDVERWGFVAHELQETLIPDAATGFKDSPEHIQSPNVWPLVATLTKALQEAMQRIENLEARLEAMP